MKKLTSNEVRKAFLDFFHKKGHHLSPSSSLVPHNDPTLLFANAGMNQFKDYFLGKEKAKFTTAASSQKCVRAGGKHNDLENVGYTARHHTFFEMLGNFSFGDYFKESAIQFAWELLTEKFGIPKDKLLVTVYHEDDEAYDIWKKIIKLPEDKIIRIGDKGEKYQSDNFWMMGDTGPCGPCSEIFYDHGDEIYGGPPGSKDEDGDRFIEIWNLVFMQFNRDEAGILHPLPAPSVDTGMGLERISAVLQGVHSNYEIDLFLNIIEDTAKILKYEDKSHASLRVIADHIRSIVFLISDGVQPGNEGRNYVLRRITRRAIRHGYKLGRKEPFLYQVSESILKNMGDAYPEILENQTKIKDTIYEEEIRFFETIDNGMKILNEAIQKIVFNNEKILSGDIAFKLHDTFGFPIDLTADICRESKININLAEFDSAMNQQKKMAKAASQFRTSTNILHEGDATESFAYESHNTEAKVKAIYINNQIAKEIKDNQEGVLILDKTSFYAESGGQIGDQGEIISKDANFEVLDTQKLNNGIIAHFGRLKNGLFKTEDKVQCQVDSDMRNAIKRNHSATHLMHKALRLVLGNHVEQKGSLVDHEKTRFDFSHPKALSHEEISKIEKLVNDEILQNSQAKAEVMRLEDAKESGAMMLFGEKYSDQVRVLSIGNSKELCGGTHVEFTGDIGLFKITSESGVSSGVRRIEATTGYNVLRLLQSNEETIINIAGQLKSNKNEITQKVKILVSQLKENEKTINELKGNLAKTSKNELLDQVEEVNGINFLAAELSDIEAPQLRNMIDELKNKLKSAVILLASIKNKKITLAIGITSNLLEKFNANEFAKIIGPVIAGNGGGKPDMAMVGGSDPKGLKIAFESIRKLL
ncbi:MAG: alanine--tRNA ligase [Nitrosomonadales bacterium]